MYLSQLNPGELIIDDDNFARFVEADIDGEQKLKGRIPRDWEREPFGSLPFAAPFPEELLLSYDEIDERIEIMERDKTRLTDLCDQAGLIVLDQDGTNYCWGNAPTHCVEVVRVGQGEQMVRLSPASICAPIKGYRNVGGWGTEGHKYIVEHGLVPQSMWPPNYWKDKKYDTPETRAIREKFRSIEWWDLRPRNEQQLLTLLSVKVPVAVGYNWWSHEVTAMDPVKLGERKYGVRIDNSWGLSYGTRGRSVLSGTKHLPDDAVAPRVVTPSSL